MVSRGRLGNEDGVLAGHIGGLLLDGVVDR